MQLVIFTLFFDKAVEKARRERRVIDDKQFLRWFRLAFLTLNTVHITTYIQDKLSSGRWFEVDRDASATRSGVNRQILEYYIRVHFITSRLILDILFDSIKYEYTYKPLLSNIRVGQKKKIPPKFCFSQWLGLRS